MKVEFGEKIAAQVEQWEYYKNLPKELQGFKLKLIGEVAGDKYRIFAYENEAIHCLIEVYYHHETKEFKLKVQVGLTDFCVVDYIADDLDEMAKKLEQRLEMQLKDLAGITSERLSCLVVETGLLEWEYIKELPKQVGNFKLFISPTKPIRTINGSYIILDYSDFNTESNFVILYNILREEFSAEMKFHNIPEITYDFDTLKLEELEVRLKEKLISTLENMEQRLLANSK